METDKTYKGSRKPVVMLLGRFQPPTIGHYYMFTQAMKVAASKEGRALGVELFPYVAIINGKETSKDKVRNPLSPEERQQFMHSSGQTNGVRFIHASNAVEAFNKIREMNREPLVIVAGSDRGQDYIRILDEYFKNDDDTPIKHQLVELKRDPDAIENTGEGDEALQNILDHMDGDIDIDMVSGSLARYAARRGDLKNLAIITGLRQGAAKVLMKKLQETGEAE